MLSLIVAEAFLYGFSYPFFSLALDHRAVPLWLIGINASLASAGILLVGPFLPRLIDALGLSRLVAGQFFVSLLCFAVLLFTDNLLVWFASRFIMGTCFASLWTTTEIWLNGISPPSHRGRIISASGTLYAISQFVGPIVLGHTGAAGSVPIIAALIPLGLGVLLALSLPSRIGETEDEEPEGSIEALVAALPFAAPLLAAAFLSGIGETAMQSLLPLYGLNHGFNVAGAAFLVAMFSLGEAVLVMGLGWLSDRQGRHFALQLCTAVAVASTALVPISVSVPPLLWVMLFLSGGTIAGLYTLGVVLIGKEYQGQKLVLVSTGFGMSYSAGSVLGATPVAAAIDALGYEVLPLGIAVLFTFLFIGISNPRWQAGD